MTTRARTDPAADRTRSLLERLLPSPRTVAVRLWNGETLPADDDPPRATLHLHDPDTLGRMLTAPIDLNAGEAFLRGEVDVEGELEAVLAALDADDAAGAPFERLRLMKDVAVARRQAARSDRAQARLRGRRHSRARDRAAIEHHYELPIDFYRLWLDPRLVYSCGYFPTGEETLEEAQEAKLELVCRKLRLERGMRLLDIGCGWGSLVRHAAERHGAEGLGVTLATNQAEEANRRLVEAGLREDDARVEVRDYRDLRGRFDRIASVGMAEHVGRDHLEAYFRSAFERLEPGGAMLNHAISVGPLAGSTDEVTSGEFIQRYVFPDGELVPIHEMLRAAEAAGFEVRDVEDLREHYATTLRHWVANLEAAWTEAVAIVGEERARVWRLFMSASAHQFARGRLAIHQALLAKPDGDGRVALPPSRADLYRA